MSVIEQSPESSAELASALKAFIEMTTRDADLYLFAEPLAEPLSLAIFGLELGDPFGLAGYTADAFRPSQFLQVGQALLFGGELTSNVYQASSDPSCLCHTSIMSQRGLCVKCIITGISIPSAKSATMRCSSSGMILTRL